MFLAFKSNFGVIPEFPDSSLLADCEFIFLHLRAYGIATVPFLRPERILWSAALTFYIINPIKSHRVTCTTSENSVCFILIYEFRYLFSEFSCSSSNFYNLILTLLFTGRWNYLWSVRTLKQALRYFKQIQGRENDCTNIYHWHQHKYYRNTDSLAYFPAMAAFKISWSHFSVWDCSLKALDKIYSISYGRMLSSIGFKGLACNLT